MRQRLSESLEPAAQPRTKIHVNMDLLKTKDEYENFTSKYLEKFSIESNESTSTKKHQSPPSTPEHLVLKPTIPPKLQHKKYRRSFNDDASPRRSCEEWLLSPTLARYKDRCKALANNDDSDASFDSRSSIDSPMSPDRCIQF